MGGGGAKRGGGGAERWAGQEKRESETTKSAKDAKGEGAGEVL